MGLVEAPRRNVQRGQGRGEATREQLLEAALPLFSSRGYDGVTTRMVTQAAGANLAAINYHFGSKRGLYEAVVADLAARVNGILGPLRADLDRALAGAGRDRAAVAAAGHGFITGLVLGMVGETARRPVVGLVMREYADPTEAFPVLYERAVRPLHEALAQVVGAARQIDPASEPAVIQAHALLGMCISFSIARVVLCRRLNWDDYTPMRVRAIAAAVAGAALQSLDLPATPGA